MRRAIPSYGKEEFLRGKGDRIGRTPYRRCVRCRMPNDTRTTAWSDSGDGLGPPTDVVVDGQTQANTKDRAVQSGCRFCGSLKWQESKPIALPDDRDLPSDEWSRRYRRKRR